MNNVTKISRLRIILFALSITTLLASCRCKEDCASFEDFRLCDAEPAKDACDENLNVFQQDSEFITVTIDIIDGEPEDELSIVFFKNDANAWNEVYTTTSALEDISDDVDGDEKRISAFIGLELQEGSVWNTGDYKVEIELTQESIPLNETQNFTIE